MRPTAPVACLLLTLFTLIAVVARDGVDPAGAGVDRPAAGLPDADSDGVTDAEDNCPQWANPGQALPDWPVPVGDSDCDGFTDDRETYLGTDPARHCAADYIPNNESDPDGWPLDQDDNQVANTTDVGAYVVPLNQLVNGDSAKQRLDLDHSGRINTLDVGRYVIALNKRCALFAGGQYAIFANNSNCSASDPFIFAASDVTITGLVHSNSDMVVSGSGNNFGGPVTYSCDFTNSGSNNSYNPPPQNDGNRPAPVQFSFSQFPCDYEYTQDTDLGSRPEVWVDFSTKTELKPGVYCSTADLLLSGSNITGNVTLVAGDELNISGGNVNLTPYWQNVLLFSSRCCPGDTAIDISAAGGNWIGIINAPDGQVKVAGGSLVPDKFDLYGAIVADRVSFSGSDYTITAAFVSAD